MNLDRTFCASDCKNYECKRMISYSVLRAAEKRDKNSLSMDDFSKSCDEYIAKEAPGEIEQA